MVEDKKVKVPGEDGQVSSKPEKVPTEITITMSDLFSQQDPGTALEALMRQGVEVNIEHDED